jgi:hypothetical protein
MIVGPKSGNINATTDVSSYTMALGANISANEQKRPTIGADDFERAVYEEEPTVAKRVVMVDKFGNKYDNTNPLPIAFDGTVNIGNVMITAQDNYPYQGDIHSSVRINDGTNDLKVNSDGSINVVVENSPDEPGLTFKYNEVTSVASGVTTNLISYTAPSGGSRISRIDVSGENVALFTLMVNGSTIMVKRTWWMEFNQCFVFDPNTEGLKLNAGDTVLVTVLHNRPDLANFEATILIQ